MPASTASPRDCEFSGSDIDPEVVGFFRSRSDRTPRRLAVADYLLDFGGRHENIVCNPPYQCFRRFLNRDVVFRAFSEYGRFSRGIATGANEFFDSHGDAVLHDAIEAIKSGEGVDDRLDSLFAPLLQTNCADPLAL